MNKTIVLKEKMFLQRLEILVQFEAPPSKYNYVLSTDYII